MIEVKGVNKRIGETEILKSINLNIQKGSILGLIGPNGAGKTSLIKTITGIWKPDKGSVTFKGLDIFSNPEVKENLGYVPDQCHYYASYRISEMLMFYKLAYKNFSQAKFKELNKIFEIPMSKRVRELSKGTKAKLSLLLNLSILPEVLILDEPTSGLDPVAKRTFTELILDDAAERKTTVLISSHNLGDLEKICENIAVIDKGEIKFFDTLDSIKKKVRKFQVVFKNGIPKDILKSEEFLNVSNIGSVLYIVTNKFSKSLEEKLISSGASLIEEINLNLEEIFIYSFGGEYSHEITM